MIIPMHELLKEAKKGGYGVAAPNVFNRETIEACFLAAKELRAPIILDVAGVHGIYECAELARFYERRYPEVPVALNLDHGGPFEDIANAIRAGFSSVMIDRSQSSFEDNVKETAEIVKFAHACGISVEAELGHVGQAFEYDKTRDSGLTRPEEAADFLAQTNVDCLAVAVGTSHGVYQGECKIDFPLLDTLAAQIDQPLVLHGGSGSGDDNLRKTIEHGIQKVNLNTDLVMTGLDAMEASYTNNLEIKVPKGVDTDEFTTKRMNMQQLFAVGADAYKNKLMHYMKLFKSEGRW